MTPAARCAALTTRSAWEPRPRPSKRSVTSPSPVPATGAYAGLTAILVDGWSTGPSACVTAFIFPGEVLPLPVPTPSDSPDSWASSRRPRAPTRSAGTLLVEGSNGMAPRRAGASTAAVRGR